MTKSILFFTLLIGCADEEKDPDDVLGNWPDDIVVVEDSGSPDVDTAEDTDTDDTNTGVDGSEVASSNCNSCHVNGYAPRFDSVIPGLSESQLMDIIQNGKGAMPAFPDLTDDELNALVQYLMDTYN